MDRHFSLKSAIRVGEISTSSKARFLGAPQVCPDSISIGSATFAQLVRVSNTHRPRYVATSVAVGRTCAQRASDATVELQDGPKSGATNSWPFVKS